MFDSPSALVRFRGIEGCAVEPLRLVRAGGSGLRLDLHAQNNHVRDTSLPSWAVWDLAGRIRAGNQGREPAQ